jgi:hypothetical protein
MELATVLDNPALEGQAQVHMLKPGAQPISAGEFPIEVTHLLDVLARIELRRQARLRGLAQEGKN